MTWVFARTTKEARLWQNAADPGEVVFLFRIDDLEHAKQFIEKVHGEALRQNPGATLSQMTFLDEVQGR